MDRASVQPRQLEWIGSSKKDLKALPDEVMDVFGYALFLARERLKVAARRAKELKNEQAQSK